MRKAMVDVFLARGYKVVSGGTENHLFLLDLVSVDKDITGKDADAALGRANITVNKIVCLKMILAVHLLHLVFVLVLQRLHVVVFKEAEAKDLAGWMCDVSLIISMMKRTLKSETKSLGYLR